MASTTTLGSTSLSLLTILSASRPRCLKSSPLISCSSVACCQSPKLSKRFLITRSNLRLLAVSMRMRELTAHPFRRIATTRSWICVVVRTSHQRGSYQPSRFSALQARTGGETRPSLSCNASMEQRGNPRRLLRSTSSDSKRQRNAITAKLVPTWICIRSLPISEAGLQSGIRRAGFFGKKSRIIPEGPTSTAGTTMS